MADEIALKTLWEKTPFGMALLDLAMTTFQEDEAQGIRRMRETANRSPTFLKLLEKSTARFVFSMPPESRSNAEGNKQPVAAPVVVDSNGMVLNARGQPTGRRAIGMYATFDTLRYTPFPDPDFPHFSGDTIQLMRAYLFGDDEHLNFFIAKAAHEMQHALSTIHPTTGTDGTSTPGDSATADFNGEAEARKTEMAVFRELGDPRGSRTFADAKAIAEQIDILSNSERVPDLTRSFPSGDLLRTYAEKSLIMVVLKKIRSRKGFNATELFRMRRRIDTTLEQSATKPAPPLQGLAYPLTDRDGHAEAIDALGVFAKDASAEAIYLDAAVLHLIERVLDYRWQAFQKAFGQSPDYFIELEKVAKENAALLLPLAGGGLTFDELYGPPSQTAPLTGQ